MIILDQQACVHCGACTAHCPTQALCLDEQDKLHFTSEICSHCLSCLPVCPCKALKEVAG